MRSTPVLSPEVWAEQQFGKADLGDLRRTRRAVKLAAQMACRPGASLPEQTGDWAATKAGYRLFQEEDVTFGVLQVEHWRATRREAGSRPVVLMVQDTSELNFTDHPATVDLGPIGDGNGRGFMLHSTLAVDPSGEGEVLGLAYQMLFCREGIRPEETRTERWHRERESQIWLKSVQEVGRGESDSRWIHVCDRYADMFELFDVCRQTQVDFVIRLAQDRRCSPGHEAAKASEHLLEWVRTLPAAGHTTLDLRRRPSRKPRKAKLLVAFSAVTVFPPKRGGSRAKPWRGWVVRVWEPNTPSGEEPIEWVLLTSVAVTRLPEALTISHWYSLRWLVEEYHKCLKTGCAVEKRQMETRDRLEACIGILTVIAVRLLQLKLQARSRPKRQAMECVPLSHVRVLAAYLNKPVKRMTIHEFWREVARLGGFLGRKSDGDPGWQTLWRGWHTLDMMTLGASLFEPAVPKCG